MNIRLSTWGTGLRDPNMAHWYGPDKPINTVSLMLHVSGNGLTDVGETFSTKNSLEWTLEHQMDRAAEYGLDIIFVIDWHLGNGRVGEHAEPESPTEFGDYHKGFAHGGVMAKLDQVVRWSRTGRPIKAVKIGNENDAAHAAYGELCERVSRRLRTTGLELIVGGGNKSVELAAPFADATSPHLLFGSGPRNWRSVLNYHVAMSGRYDTKIYPMEMIALGNPQGYRGYLQEVRKTIRAINNGDDFSSCFEGNTTDDDGTEWPTGRVRKPPITLNQNEVGTNKWGDQWLAHHGFAGGPPIEPPVVTPPQMPQDQAVALALSRYRDIEQEILISEALEGRERHPMWLSKHPDLKQRARELMRALGVM